jgi:hypothetical protein
MNDKPTEEYAVVDDQYLLPLEDAVALIRILAKSKAVSRTYKDDVPYKPSEYGKMRTLTTITLAQYAAIHLE